MVVNRPSVRVRLGGSIRQTPAWIKGATRQRATLVKRFQSKKRISKCHIFQRKHQCFQRKHQSFQGADAELKVETLHGSQLRPLIPSTARVLLFEM